MKKISLVLFSIAFFVLGSCRGQHHFLNRTLYSSESPTNNGTIELSIAANLNNADFSWNSNSDRAYNSTIHYVEYLSFKYNLGSTYFISNLSTSDGVNAVSYTHLTLPTTPYV